VAFAPNGGWVILAGDYAFSRNSPSDCYAKVRSFQGSNRLVHLVAFTPSSGWSVISNETVSSRPRDEIRSFEGDVQSGSLQQTIWQRMRASNVPGVAVACVLENRLAWSCGYGHLRGTSGHAVHPETVFQAASISKTIAAIGAMKLVEYGRINLSDDIRDLLTSWTVPIQQGLRVTTAPTLEHLLSHRAGFNVRGFDGYDTSDESKVPDLEEILAGSSSKTGIRVNNRAVQITQNPGSYMYSGGGLQVLERLMEDVSSRHFRQWMDAHILGPVGMSRSTFELKPPASYFTAAQVATAHSATGSPHRYTPGRLFPQAAAAGLLTTAEDLGRVIMMMNGGGRLGSLRILQDSTVEDMLTARATIRGDADFSQIGLGFKLQGARTNASFRYGHGGTNGGSSNDPFGFKGLLLGYPNRRAGVVVLTNGTASDGVSFRRAVAGAVVRAYGW
jgi:CubicO group peptidase (beta-lactamase class C family)